jgi:hypothetical protein
MVKKKDDASAKPSEVTEQIGQKKLKALLKAATEAYKEGREIAGTIGQKIGEAVENDRLHRKAFSVLRGMDRMTPEKLADFWDTLQFYVDASGLGERAKAALRLPLDAGDDDDDATEGNVKAFPTPASAH